MKKTTPPALVTICAVFALAGAAGAGAAVRTQLDYDDDGTTDYSVLRFPTGACPGTPKPVTYYNLDSMDGFQAVRWGDACSDFPAPGDYDGDGKDDFAIYRSGATEGAPSFFYILRSSDSGAQVSQWGLFGDQTVARDYDGDGRTDIAIFRRGAVSADNTVWWILQSSTGTVRVVPFGTTGNGTSTYDTPVAQDFDGDGKSDIAVYRFGLPPANTYIVLRSSDSSVSYQQWGNFNTDFVVDGDFDGDGKADKAIARTGVSAPMVWWILQSSNGQVRVVQFGLSSDLPAPGDYDGDGKTDISVYREGAAAGSQSFFFALGSETGAFLVQPWGLAGDFAVATSGAR